MKIDILRTGIAISRCRMQSDTLGERFSWKSFALLAVVLCLGTFARIYPSSGFKNIGVDEHQYAVYTEGAVKNGLANYGRVIDDYIVAQVKRHDAIVPATRIGLIWPAAIISRVTGVEALRAVRIFSTVASVLLLLATAVIGYRLGNPRRALLVATLMAVAPLQISLSQRSLADEPFAFWAVLTAWTFFEAMRNRESRFWPAACALSVFALVLTKENAAFVCAALFAVWLVFVIARLVRPNYALLAATGAAGLAAILILAAYLGGLSEWLTFYRLYAAKSATIPYVLRFQDGAWYRYLIDFTVVSPAIVALTFTRLTTIQREEPSDIFWALFLGFSFVVMSIVPYGMSLRFAAFWDLPLRWLAASGVAFLMGRFGLRWQNLVMFVAVVFLVVVDLTQYHRLFVKGAIYDPVSEALFRASNLVK